MKKTLLIILLFGITLLQYGCCSCRKGSPVIGNLEQTSWKLIEINEKPSKESIIVNFDPSSKVITGNCKNCKLFGGYHLYEKEEGNIEFTTPGWKGENCEELSELTEILKEIATVKIDSGHLLLIDKEGNIKAIFSEK